jgi:hypothetical protein
MGVKMLKSCICSSTFLIVGKLSIQVVRIGNLMMKKSTYRLPLLSICITSVMLGISGLMARDTLRAAADWNFIVYIQADNNLAPFARYNVSDMQTATIPSNVNVLVQWDQPDNNKTWRYRIITGGKIDVGSLSVEMGINPAQELVDMVAWAKTNYDARNWLIDLWNHGGGIRTLAGRSSLLKKTALDLPIKNEHSWIILPGQTTDKKNRGILYDDSQHTYLDNAGLTSVLQGMKNIIGKKIDILATDACLMQMLEIAYQIQGSANYLVGAENSIPGEGFPYSAILNVLGAEARSITASQFSRKIVAAYGNFYRRDDNTMTLSALDLNNINPIRSAINSLVGAIDACYARSSAQTLSAVRLARITTASFDVADYIDLVSLCKKLVIQFNTLSRRNSSTNKALASTALTVVTRAQALQRSVASAIIANQVGSVFSEAGGLSVYYPQGSIDSSYESTVFAQSSSWLSFLQRYR